MMCPHGGTISATVAGAPRATAGAQILTDADTFTIAGCPLNISGSPHPCVSVRWISASLKAKASNAAILTSDSQGLCIAGDQAPQGPPVLTPSQSQASAT
jgi:hypothetical protein